jgi:hypothetical protein
VRQTKEIYDTMLIPLLREAYLLALEQCDDPRADDTRAQLVIMYIDAILEGMGLIPEYSHKKWEEQYGL